MIFVPKNAINIQIQKHNWNNTSHMSYFGLFTTDLPSVGNNGGTHIAWFTRKGDSNRLYRSSIILILYYIMDGVLYRRVWCARTGCSNNDVQKYRREREWYISVMLSKSISDKRLIRLKFTVNNIKLINY